MFKRWLILMTLGLFFFMVIIDGTIVVVAVPTIAQALAVQPSRVNLLLTVYLTTISVCLLFFGQLADQVGRTRLFIHGTYWFLLGSAVAGLGVNLQLVLAHRSGGGCEYDHGNELCNCRRCLSAGVAGTGAGSRVDFYFVRRAGWPGDWRLDFKPSSVGLYFLGSIYRLAWCVW